MTTYTYHLAKDFEVKRAYGHRLTCPSCGRPKCFVPYVDAWGEPISTEVGKCDHQNSCGYHYKPSEWKRDHQDLKQLMSDRPIRIVPPIKRLRSYIQPEIYQRTWWPDYHGNSLAAFLLKVFPLAAVEWCINEYRFGTSKDGSCVFWQFDHRGMCRTGKVMLYDPQTGHRVKKDGNGRVTWAHTKLGLNDFNLEQCLFGLHRVAEHDALVAAGECKPKPIAIFESEKTAMLASLLLNGNGFPCIPVATGGGGNLTPKMLAPLANHDIVLFPDEGMFAKWYDLADRQLQIFKSVRISPVMERNHYGYMGDGCDLGDWLVEHMDNNDIMSLDWHLSLFDIG